jgi:hypothetical protein
MKMTLCYVTAFLDIGRSEWKIFSRDFDNYLNAFLPHMDLFKKTRNIENYKMYVYIDERLYSSLIDKIGDINHLPIYIIKINESYLLEYMPLWSRLYRETEIMESVEFKTLIKDRLDFPETHIPKYTLINHLKVDFIAHTINLTDSTNFCWVDFGYFKNKNSIPDQLIDTSLLKDDKINYVLINNLEDSDKDIYYTLKYAPEKIGGFFFFGGRSVLLEYQKLYHEVHLSFQDNNLVDDDQHIALQCYFKRSDLFELHFQGVWHMALVHFQKKMYTIILPIKIDSGNGYILFCDLALKSYEKYLDLSRLEYFYIITPADNIPFLTKFTDKYNIPFKYIQEEDIIDNSIDTNGWFKQQLIKILISEYITTDIYLIVDSDLYLTQHLSYNDLFYKNKIKYNYEPWQTENNEFYSQNSEWWTSSCKILEYPVELLHNNNYLMSVTPEIIITSLMKLLIQKLKDICGSNWKNIICSEKFTEFTLYWIFMIQTESTNLYTTEGFPLWKHDLSHNILDYSSVSCDNIINSFITPKSYFSVIQGYLKLDVTSFIQEANKYLNRPTIDSIVLVSAMLSPKKIQFFSIEERHNQVLETVKSARKYLPNSLCILVDGSPMEKKYETDYRKVFDYVILPSYIPEVKKEVNNPLGIGFGECILLNVGILYIKEFILPYYDAKFIIKLGGRYNLTDNFSIAKYDPDKFNFYQLHDKSLDTNVYNSKVYSIPLKYLEIYENMLKNSKKSLRYKYDMVEQMYMSEIPINLINYLDKLGVEGRLSYNGLYFHD